jgi:hypothetical protein
VINVKNIIINNILIIFIIVNVSIIIHLGKNPKNGGNPPKDKRTINKKTLIKELLLNILKV